MFESLDVFYPTISKNNSKLGAIGSINLPPVVTCNPSAPCRGGACYACRGRFRCPTVRASLQRNLLIYQTAPGFFFECLRRWIDSPFAAQRFFRFHAAGDFPDADYFRRACDLANAVPGCSFLAFTKKFDAVNDYISAGGIIPENFAVVFSAWGDAFPVPNPHGLPVAYVRLKKEPCTIPADAEPCAGDCMTCLRCWSLKRGASVVFNQH